MNEILDLINQETGINFETIIGSIIFYLVFIWILFSLWVFVDARKRFGNYYIAALFSFFVFVFNFPALLFYIIARPDDYNEERHDTEVMNVPLANFINEEGDIAMTINLTLNPKLTRNEKVIEVNKDLFQETTIQKANKILFNRKKIVRKIKNIVRIPKKYSSIASSKTNNESKGKPVDDKTKSTVESEKSKENRSENIDKESGKDKSNKYKNNKKSNKNKK